MAIAEMSDGTRSPSVWGSRGDWAACDVCHGMIERGERGALVERALATLPGMSSGVTSDPGLHLALNALHAAFFEARTGPARVELP